MSIVGALTIMGGSAFAAFTTTATATNTTFSTTDPELQVAVNGDPFGITVAGPVVTGLIPGVAGATQTFTLKDTSVPGVAQPVALKLTPTGSNTLSGADLTIVVNCGAGDITDTYSGWITGHAIGTVPAGSTLACTMIPTLNPGVGDTAADKDAIFDAVFSGTIGT